MSPAVRFFNVSRRFGSVRAVDGVTLDIAEGEFFAMLGPSGSGKTTCLRLIAGFEQPDEGHIEIFGETLGLNSDASIWRHACDHLREWFPGLGTEWNFVRRCSNLSWLKARVQDALFHPSGDWNAFFPCRCAGTHGRDGTSGSGARRHGPSALPSRRSTTGSRPGC